MSTSRRRPAVALVAAVVLLPIAAAPARAETTPPSTITQIKVLETGDSNYALFHGAVWLAVDKAEHNYRWGGKYCPRNTLSEASRQLLFDAFRGGYNVAIDYKPFSYRDKVYRCITAFTVTKG
jgi:hypothetical protein